MYRVLVVDDEPSVYEGLKLLINWNELGFREPNCAFDFEEAINRLDEDKYHVVITDIRMPGTSGLDLLKEISKKSPGIRVLILSGYECFGYLKEAMKYGAKDYLLKPVNRYELVDCLKKLKAEMDNEHIEKHAEIEKQIGEKKRFLHDLATGSLMKYELDENIAKYNLTYGVSEYCIALVEIVGFSEMVGENCYEAKNTRAVISDLVEEILVKWNIGEVYDETDGLLGLILYQEGSSLNKKKIETCLNEICSLAEKSSEQKIITGYGNLVKSLDELKISRSNALTALDRRFLAAGSNVISYDTIISREEILSHIEWDPQSLIDALIYSDSKGIAKSIGELINEFSAKAISVDDISNTVLSIIYDLSELVKKYGGNPDAVFAQPEIRSLFADSFTLENLENWLNKTCAALKDYLQACNSRNKKSNIDLIKKYIDDHISENLNVKLISKEFYINPAYLGQLFKKAYGETIIDYINRKKIAEVKLMVASGDFLVHVAIGKMGFRNQGYFYKKFRQYENMTFAEFNQKLKRARNTIEKN